MDFWWVNQNQTFKEEVLGGFLWSPKANKNGAKNQFYSNMTLISPGDIVFSFCDARITAIGRVLGAAETKPKPDFGTAGSNWNKEGWHVPVEFTELNSKVRPKDIINDLRPHLPEKYSPLQKSGDGLQGVYLAALSSEFAQVLLSALGSEAEEIVFGDVGELADQDDQVQTSIEGRTDIGPTVKRQLINSRRGQGIFRSNVHLNERRCRLTGETDLRLLVASHIKPWKDSGDHEKLDGCNGLLLSPHVDRLFDKGFISFHDNGDVMISEKLDLKTLERWGLNKIVNVGVFSTSHAEYLAHHREFVFKP
jgi:putative restriction endonuclease